MWFVIGIVAFFIIRRIFDNSETAYEEIDTQEVQFVNGDNTVSEKELLDYAKKEVGIVVSELGRISVIPNLRHRSQEYNIVRNYVLSRRHEPIGRMLEAAFNTFTEVDRDLVDGIAAQ